MINKFQEGGQLEQILTMVAQFLLQNGQAQDEQTAMQSAQQLVQAAQSGNQEAQAALQQIMLDLVPNLLILKNSEENVQKVKNQFTLKLEEEFVKLVRVNK